jgi:YD repeat-containing protein
VPHPFHSFIVERVGYHETKPNHTTSTKTYDFRNNVIDETDQAGNITHHTYDQAGRVAHPNFSEC